MTTLDHNLGTGGRELRGGPGRGVLEGAFVLLDVLAGHEDGAGLSALAREADLPKSTTYRLVEQLVELGAVERHGRRYVVGRLMGRIGASWRPNPTLRQAARDPVNALAKRTGAATVLTILRDGKPKTLVSTAGAMGAQVYALPMDSTLPAQTAAGQVLFTAGPDGPAGHAPAGTHGVCSPSGWNESLVWDRQDVLPGVCCVATGVCLPDGRPVGAINALVLGTAVPRGVGDLVRQASWTITRNLAVPFAAH